MATEIKKYASLESLQTFKENLDNEFSTLSHKHTVSDITDYKVDAELSSTSSNPVENKVIDAEFEAISKAMNALESEIDTKLGITTASSTYETKDDATAKLTEAKSYTDTKTAPLASTTSVENKISAHNTATDSHNDIRTLITDLTTKLNNFLDVDDTTTDQLSEVITLINNNKGTLESLTTNKINVSDIVNNLTTNSTSKVLSAAQGVAIKDLIDALEAELDAHTHEIADVNGLQSALDGKAEASHGTHVSYSTTAPVMDGTASAGTASTVARSDHKHPTDTSRASQADLDTHTGNTTVHITSAERTAWGAAYTHSNSEHAPSNAEKNQNAFSNIKVSSTTVAADNATDTVEFVGSNVTITPDANNDKITFAVDDGSTSAKGLLQLTDSTSSTSTTTAATPNSVKSAYDLANTANTAAANAQAAADSAQAAADNAAANAAPKNTWYGTCSTAASTAAKVVTTSTGDFTLTTGNIVYVLFTYAAYTGSTLNVDGTGAVTIKISGTSNVLTYQWGANEAIGFVYDGTNFRMLDGMIATTTYYGMTKLSSSTSSTSTTTAATPSAVKSAYDLANAAMPNSGGTFTGAVYAGSSNQTYSTYLLRNTRLASSATNPTVNGQICWTYG